MTNEINFVLDRAFSIGKAWGALSICRAKEGVRILNTEKSRNTPIQQRIQFIEPETCIRIRRKLSEAGIEFKRDIELNQYSWIMTGGSLSVLALPRNHAECATVMQILREEGVPPKVIGATSNLLFLDQLRYGPMISLSKLVHIERQEDAVIVDAGYPMPKLVRWLCVKGLGGLEGLEGIPGTLGGAIVMNAGAYGYSVSDTLSWVEVMTPYGSVHRYSPAQCKFGHRSSTFQNNPNLVILRACLALVATDTSTSAKTIERIHIARHSYLEYSLPTLGSLFATNDIYAALANTQDSKLLGLAIRGVRALTRNRFAKFMKRRNPNQSELNWLVQRWFRWQTQDYQYSDKTLNAIVNRGQGTGAMLNHIKRLSDLIGTAVSLENEIVVTPVLTVGSETEFELACAIIYGTERQKVQPTVI